MNSNVAEIRLSYSTNVKASERVSVVSSREAYDVLRQNWPTNEFIETFKVILLNRSNRALGIFEVSTGGSTGTVADPKLIFAAAIKANACGIIMAHNHPSGNLNPSQADIDLTKRMKEGGKLLEVQVLDHLILTKERGISALLTRGRSSPLFHKLLLNWIYGKQASEPAKTKATDCNCPLHHLSNYNRFNILCLCGRWKR
jgi:DNA repair protein RadC